MEDEDGKNMKDSFVWCPEILESTRIGRRVRPDTKESQKQKSNQVFRPEGSKSADAPSAFPFGSVNRIQFSEPFCMTQEGGVQEKKETFLPGVYFGVGAFVARTKVRQWRKIGDINFLATLRVPHIKSGVKVRPFLGVAFIFKEAHKISTFTATRSVDQMEHFIDSNFDLGARPAAVHFVLDQ